jgi:mannose-6-phosphate isomerase-like protein (cupin superfamily)
MVQLVRLAAALLLASAALPAVAQAPAAAPAAPAQPPVVNTFASAADVAALIAKAKAEQAGRPTVLQRIMTLPPYNTNLEYRTAADRAALHEDRAEIFYVIDGSGTLTTGGQLINETRANPTNRNGTGIANGVVRKVAKGDFFFVPENTPHFFNQIDGTLVLMSMHVPRNVAATPAPPARP